jgi:hypothetical protein
MQNRCSEYFKGWVLFGRHRPWLHTHPTSRVRRSTLRLLLSMRGGQRDVLSMSAIACRMAREVQRGTVQMSTTTSLIPIAQIDATTRNTAQHRSHVQWSPTFQWQLTEGEKRMRYSGGHIPNNLRQGYSAEYLAKYIISQFGPCEPMNPENERRTF